MNSAFFTGRITKELKLKCTPSGKMVCEFTIAVNRVGQDATDFINCVVWDKQAENLAKYQGKGSLIAVAGSLRVDNYQNAKGENRQRTCVLVNSIEYLSSKSSSEVSKEENPADDTKWGSAKDMKFDDPEELPFY